VPAGHLVQSAFATVGLNVPGTHCSQIPFRNEYPSLQAHCDKKTLPGGEDEPDGQSVHTVAEETDENLPASHIKHALGSLLTRYPGKQERNDADVLPMMPSAVTLSPDPAVLEVLPDEYGVELDVVGAGVLDDDAAGVLPPLVPDADVLPMLPSAVVVSAPTPDMLEVLPVGYGVELDDVGAGVLEEDMDVVDVFTLHTTSEALITMGPDGVSVPDRPDSVMRDCMSYILDSRPMVTVIVLREAG
jgi:hypothetical protein